MIPTPPDVPDDQRAAAAVSVRYEDIAQDGRLMLLAMPHAIGEAIWQHSLVNHPFARATQRAGIIPVLTRFAIEGAGGPVSVRRPLDAEGRFALAHTVDERGEPDRLILNIWVSLNGVVGRTHGPPPPDAGQPIYLGRVFAEHVFTRPFAPPDQRRITRFDVPGMAPVPPDRYAWHPPDTLLELPPGARPLENDLVADAAPVVFGLTHTDSNQHVNSIVYPRLFEDAALRRLAARGLGARFLAREAEVAYRKPCFAGDRVELALRAFVHADGRPGVAGVFRPEASAGAPPARPICCLRMTFSP